MTILLMLLSTSLLKQNMPAFAMLIIRMKNRLHLNWFQKAYREFSRKSDQGKIRLTNGWKKGMLLKFPKIQLPWKCLQNPWIFNCLMWIGPLGVKLTLVSTSREHKRKLYFKNLMVMIDDDMSMNIFSSENVLFSFQCQLLWWKYPEFNILNLLS